MPEITGPVQILAVGFREGARFEGRIAEQIDQLEQSNTIRVLDFVFLHRDEATRALVRLDYDGPDRDGRVTTLLEGASTGGGSSDQPRFSSAMCGQTEDRMLAYAVTTHRVPAAAARCGVALP